MIHGHCPCRLLVEAPYDQRLRPGLFLFVLAFWRLAPAEHCGHSSQDEAGSAQFHLNVPQVVLL